MPTSFVFRVREKSFLHGFRGDNFVLIITGWYCLGYLGDILQCVYHRDVSKPLGNRQCCLTILKNNLLSWQQCFTLPWQQKPYNLSMTTKIYHEIPQMPLIYIRTYSTYWLVYKRLIYNIWYKKSASINSKLHVF